MKSKKRLIIIVSLLVVIAAAVAVVLIVMNKKDEYRLLKVFEVEGTANVARDGKGDIAPYVNMVLESGDKVSLDTGKLSILADDDKYIYLEEQTEILLKASGNASDSKTKIEVLKGSITNDIQNKLSEDSTYEVNTPNSTMSVRGTVFFVMTYEVDGVKYTRVCVFDGQVDTKLLFKDGTVDKNSVSVMKGKEVTIYEDGTTTDYVSEPTDIDYSTLPESVLLKLKSINEEGKELSITNPEIIRILEGPYNVTFTYNGSVFGTQTVNKGEKATEPKLAPAENGKWDYNFNDPVERDITIEWK
ncbi:MAG: FecR domain-containing protein [Eubacterium sp.]|nr:FecR domain-containing protein [Eubacterium sp.]